MRTAQAGQTLLFLLTMLLAGMVLSNLVEEKANKIIEILAAAIPMDAVFLGKLFAMLGISFVGIAVWGATIGSVLLFGGHSLAEVAAPAVGWPMFLGLGVLYFAMAYLLLGSVFLTIGSMAATVREVQTLSMPVTMMQLLVFFLASYTVASPGSALELVAAAIPFSSPFAMLARAAQTTDLTQHVLALGWQAAWVVLFVRFGAQLFRRRVMKSGPAVKRRPKRPKRQAQQA
jgi:ABC-2 type transport system permease protein